MGREVVGAVARRIEAETAIAHNNIEVVVVKVVRTMILLVGRALSLSHTDEEGSRQQRNEGTMETGML